MAEHAKPAYKPRRTFKTKPLGDLVGGLTKRAMTSRGFENPAIVQYWDDIVGERLAGRTRPQRIVFPGNRRNGGVLHVTVTSPSLALEIQHDTPNIIEKINGFFGYGAVAALKLHIRFEP